MPPSRHPKPYLDLSRRRRRDVFVSTRWQIANDPDGCGRFTTDILLPGMRGWSADYSAIRHADPDQPWHARARFLSQRHARQGWVYRLELRTVELAVIDGLDALVERRLEQAMLDQGLTASQVYPRQGGTGWPRVFEGPLGDRLGLIAMTGRLWQAIIPADWAAARVGTRVNTRSARGIDVEAVVDSGSMTVSVLREFVDGFWSAGERPDPGHPSSGDAAAIQRAIDVTATTLLACG